MNKAIIGGMISEEIKVFNSNGSSIVNFVVSTKDSKDDKVEKHNCVAFKDNAVKCQTLNQGDIVYLEGKINTQTWEQQGKPRYKKQIIVFRIEIVKRKQGTEPLVNQQQQKPKPNPPTQQQKPKPAPEPDNVVAPDFSGEEEIPF